MAQYFTKEGLEKLKDELKDIKGRQMKEVKKLIAEARAFGDLKENAGYHDARDKMSFLLGRAAQLEAAINEAIVKEKPDEKRVDIGSHITVLFGKEKQEYHVVAPTESNILQNKISYQSPMGKVLMNRGEGEEFDFNPPAGGNGEKLKIKILKIK